MGLRLRIVHDSCDVAAAVIGDVGKEHLMKRRRIVVVLSFAFAFANQKGAAIAAGKSAVIADVK